MSLKFTDHAARRLVQRYLDERDVMLTIAFPDGILERPDGATESRKTLGMKHITVVWHRDSRGNYIVRTII